MCTKNVEKFQRPTIHKDYNKLTTIL